MSDWFDFTILDQTLHLMNGDLLDVFNLHPNHVQFSLVFLLVTALMWVMLPLVEWAMIQNWSRLFSYIMTALVALAFLQAVDRYAMVQSQSLLPDYYWPVCLLAISSYGVLYVSLKGLKHLWVQISKRSKKKAA
ncbi:hypothetical protein LCL89_06300 [Halobacillus yeomjeoni]|uniref:hypothetical protein n=1 Tax=Halobacillus yeomjeoni TaxID=311194 RepID=UPI001CD653E6|nr:hypothetical protein [Halobacillus yeomjeoni]MCA0983666.1 hypothetical protein [Halobacillus yeomjeoni]